MEENFDFNLVGPATFWSHCLPCSKHINLQDTFILLGNLYYMSWYCFIGQCGHEVIYGHAW